MSFHGRNRLWLLLILFMFVFSSVVSAQEANEIIRLRPGAQKILKVQNIKKVALGDTEVAKATLVGDTQVLITGVQAGQSTNLTIWFGDGTLKTYDIVVQTITKSEINGMVTHIKGVEVKEVGTKIVMYGKVNRVEEYQTTESIARRFPEVVNLVTLKQDPKQVLTTPEEIEKKISIPTVKVSVVNDTILLMGQVYSKKEFERAEKIAKAYGNNVINAIKVDEAVKQVEIDIIYASVNISHAKEYGANLLAALNISTALSRNSTQDQDGIGIGNGATSAAAGALGLPKGTAAAVGVDALSTLKFLKSKGAAHVLAKPHLSVVSGEEAKLLNGGERGFKVAGTGTANVEFKEYGLIMKIKPDIDDQNKVTADISLELSLPVGNAGTDEELAFTKFQTSSRVNCEMGKTIVMSGLFEAFTNNSRIKTPLLGDIPILGYLFSKKKSELQNIRLVILVTPHMPTVVDKVGKPGSQDYDEIINTATEGLKGDEKKKKKRNRTNPRY